MLPYSLELVSSAGDGCENEEELCLPKKQKTSYDNLNIFSIRKICHFS